VGLPQTGVVPIGSYVVEPGAIRVDQLRATVGQPVQPGSPILHATSTARQVAVALDAAQQSQVKQGERVTITLPDNSTTPGVVSSVGAVATTAAPAGGQNGAASDSSAATQDPTITVEIRPTRPADTGHLDQAPVTVAITTGTVSNALVVPVTALLALAGGGYALEVAEADGQHHLVAVRLGLFDDADGLVQVSGSAVRAGQRVVVPARP
jgi:HlyD family secretion protein